MSAVISPAPDLRDVYDRFGWHALAACRGANVNFFASRGGTNDEISSGSRLLPLLYCATCPVRRPCLEQGMQTWAVTWEHDDRRARWALSSVGCWGGTWEIERMAVRKLEREDAITVLEATFAKRLKLRIKAWSERDLWRRSLGVQRTRIDKAITERLEQL